MGKTITIRIDDTVYQRIKSAAESERRTISNFMEYAALAYIESSSFIDEEEMKHIAQDKELMTNLKKSMEDIRRGSYRIVE